MVAKCTSHHTKLKFKQMDATKMKYEDGTFSVVLDKGTLDALMPTSETEVLCKINSYFGEITRVLRICGRFICISLLQEHILKALLSYFPQNGFLFRISRCFEVEKKAQENGENTMPVFIVICTKLTKLQSPVSFYSK